MPSLEMWTIYANPDDYPGEYVARKWVLLNGQPQPTNVTVKSKTLAKVRRKIPRGLICMQRAESDDPGIVETWL